MKQSIKTYTITGMTCTSCVARVQAALQKIAGVQAAEVSLQPAQTVIASKMPISLQTFKNALAAVGNYDIFVADDAAALPAASFQVYKPLVIIAIYLVLVCGIAAHFDFMAFMRYFMAGFFIVFSFFKMLDIEKFAQSYAMYDILAKKIPIYAKIFPFIELALGLAYLSNFQPFYTNIFTIFITTISILGVIQSLRSKQKIRCACLGMVFQLPMTTVTFIENALMIAMAAMALVM